MPELSLSEFADRLNETIPLVMREFARRQLKELYKDKITLPQLLILEFLHKEGEPRMSYLAHFMNVTTAAMTGIVDRLVRDSYAARVYDTQDRRIIKIKLTNRGLELLKNINEQRRKMVVRIFGRLPEDDRGEYLRILTAIKDILSNEEAEK